MVSASKGSSRMEVLGPAAMTVQPPSADFFTTGPQW
jgi:hypothetical protein